MKFSTFIDNGFEEVDVDIYYDYQPAERATRYYPGCGEEVCINQIFRADNQIEIFLIDTHESGILCENIIEDIRGF